MAVHGLLLGVALLLSGHSPAVRHLGEEGQEERVWSGTLEPPAAPSEPEEPPEVELLEPPELTPIESPLPELPEPAPDLQVTPDAPPEPEQAPMERPLERPFEPTPADAGRRVRSRTTPRTPEPSPSVPAQAPPAAGRPALKELERPDPPRPPGVPTDADLDLQLEYTVALDGHVSDARVVRSSGWPVLDEATREFVLRHWRYAPPGEERRVLRRVRFRRAE